MQVEEVHFNHNPGSVVGDALTICRNGTTGAIVAPEWTRGTGRREPAAYARDVAGPVTIKAKFSGGPANGTVSIRAVDANAPPAQPPAGCLGLISWFFQKLINALTGTIGDVAATFVSFDGSGTSSLVSMPLNSPWLAQDGFVAKRNTVWRWQQETDNNVWTDFDTTQHTIYVVLDTPTAPWVQAGDATQLPWADALDTACTWAVGARTKDDAAARITDAVNRVPNVSYTPSTMFGFTDYYLKSYLNALSGGPFMMNCTDCADAVTTLSNLLGCNLAEGRFFNLDTKPFLTLSGDASNPADWVTWNWSYHEICWLNDFASNTVWDGCLQLDMSNTPAHLAQLPVKMTFDSPSPDDYKSRLIASGTGDLEGFNRHRRVV